MGVSGVGLLELIFECAILGIVEVFNYVLGNCTGEMGGGGVILVKPSFTCAFLG